MLLSRCRWSLLCTDHVVALQIIISEGRDFRPQPCRRPHSRRSDLHRSVESTLPSPPPPPPLPSPPLPPPPPPPPSPAYLVHVSISCACTLRWPYVSVQGTVVSAVCVSGQRSAGIYVVSWPCPGRCRVVAHRTQKLNGSDESTLKRNGCFLHILHSQSRHHGVQFNMMTHCGAAREA